jgi:hypothetical protein
MLPGIGPPESIEQSPNAFPLRGPAHYPMVARLPISVDLRQPLV